VHLVRYDQSRCAKCYQVYRTEKERTNIAKALAARADMRAAGHDSSRDGQAAERRGSSQRRHRELNLAWKASQQPTMPEQDYRTRVQPALLHVPTRDIAEVMEVTSAYAKEIQVPTSSLPSSALR
jgi:hypothetical protein